MKCITFMQPNMKAAFEAGKIDDYLKAHPNTTLVVGSHIQVGIKLRMHLRSKGISVSLSDLVGWEK